MNQASTALRNTHAELKKQMGRASVDCLRLCQTLAALIAFASVGLSAVGNTTVAHLTEVIGAAVSGHRSDKYTATLISTMELSERITEDELAVLQSRGPGPLTAKTLEELAGQSAFLEPPIAERNSAPPPPLGEQRRILKRAGDYLMEYAHELPNLICSQSIVRFDDNRTRRTDGLRSLGRMHFLDTLTTHLTYSNGDEEVRISALNGKPKATREVIGSTTHGEFGNIIISLFLPEARTKATWSHWEVLHGRRVAVFRYTVPAATSNFVVAYGCLGGKQPKSITPEYAGFLFIGADDGKIVRVTRSAVGLPRNFPTQRADAAVEYRPVSIGGQSYMLPVRSVEESEAPAGCHDIRRLLSLNEARFYDYRKFDAESRMVASVNAKADSHHQVTSPDLVSTEPEAASVAQPAPPETDSPATVAPPVSSAFSLPLPPPFAEPQKADAVNDTFATHAAFRERVNIAIVPVVVRNREGLVVAGLEKEDFELTDNGKPQTISNFVTEIAARKAARPDIASRVGVTDKADTKAIPDRYVAYVFDDIHLSLGDISQTRSAVERLLSELLEPGTRMAVLTTSGHVRQDFTSESEKIAVALKRLKPSPAAPPHAGCPDVSHYVADKIVNQNDRMALDEVMREAIEDCGVDRKSAENVAQSAAVQSLTVHDYEARATLDAIRNIAQGMAALPGERRMILVSPGFYISLGQQGMQDVIERAARSGVVVDALDAKGLYGPAGTDASERSTSPAKFNYQTEGQDSNAGLLMQLAGATGGRVFRNSNDYDAGFRRLAESPGIVYLIGFSPPDSNADGSYHKLKVTVRGRKGLEIQARRGYLARKEALDSTKEAKEEIQNALLSRDEMRDIPVELKLAAPAAEADRKMSAALHVDAKSIQFQKRDGRNRDKLTIMFGLFDGNGGLLAALEEQVPLDFDDQNLHASVDKGLNVQSDLELKPGTQFVRMVLRDAEGQMSTVNEVVR
jgi:VWFA-related protein